MRWTGWVAGVVVTVLGAARVDAQTGWDVAGAAGLFLAHADRDTAGSYGEDWSTAAQGSAVLGRYLSRHLKVELEGSTTTRGRQYVSTPVTAPGNPYPVWLPSEVETSIRSLGSVVVWQFRDNEWVHPFALAGVSADWDDIRVLVPQQPYYGDGRGLPVPVTAPQTGHRTDFHVRGLVGGGAKLYFTERAFVRTDGRLTWSPDRQHFALRAGLGIDF